MITKISTQIETLEAHQLGRSPQFLTPHSPDGFESFSSNPFYPGNA
jgi:hypothetical protein